MPHGGTMNGKMRNQKSIRALELLAGNCYIERAGAQTAHVICSIFDLTEFSSQSTTGKLQDTDWLQLNGPTALITEPIVFFFKELLLSQKMLFRH